MDAERIRTVGNHRQAWVKVDHSQDRSVSYRETIELFSFDCAARSYRLLSYVDYDSYGKVVNSHSQPDYSYGTGYEPIIPDSIGETISTVACAGQSTP